VQGAKSPSYKFLVAGIFIQCQQCGLKLDKDFTGLFEERLLVFIDDVVLGQNRSP
jgi:hypothetical protein